MKGLRKMARIVNHRMTKKELFWPLVAFGPFVLGFVGLNFVTWLGADDQVVRAVLYVWAAALSFVSLPGCIYWAWRQRVPKIEAEQAE